MTFTLDKYFPRLASSTFFLKLAEQILKRLNAYGNIKENIPSFSITNADFPQDSFSSSIMAK